MNRFCTNCGAPLAPQHAASRKKRRLILLIVTIVLVPFLMISSVLLSIRVTLSRRNADGDLVANSITFSVSKLSALEEALEDITGDDLAVSITKSEAFYECAASFDGACFGRDRSVKILRLTYLVENPTDPTLNFSFSQETPMEDAWLDSGEDLSIDSGLQYEIDQYLEKRSTRDGTSRPVESPAPDTTAPQQSASQSDGEIQV